MTYKESFLIYLLKNMFNEFINGKKFKNGQDIYDSIEYGDGIHDYIVIPETSTIYNVYDMREEKLMFEIDKYKVSRKIFDIHQLNDENYIESLKNNIYYHLETQRECPHIKYGSDFSGWVDYRFDNNSWVNIDKKVLCDKKDKNKINVELYTMREACDSNRNNEYITVEEDYIYACSSKITLQQDMLVISKSYIYNDLKEYVEVLLSKSPKNFNEEVFQEFLKMLCFDNNYKCSLLDEEIDLNSSEIFENADFNTNLEKSKKFWNNLIEEGFK